MPKFSCPLGEILACSFSSLYKKSFFVLQVDSIDRSKIIIMQTENLKLLRELRTQEKALKASIESIKPFAIAEALALCPDGGKFPVEGVGDFVLDKDPVLEKDPDDKDYTGPDILTSTVPEAVSYRRFLREQNAYKKQAGGLTKTIKGFYDAFKAKFAHKATKFTYTLKCLGID